jgi:hypothetical protein
VPQAATGIPDAVTLTVSPDTATPAAVTVAISLAKLDPSAATKKLPGKERTTLLWLVCVIVTAPLPPFGSIAVILQAPLAADDV